MKIGIDARFLGPEGTGIGRYVEKLIQNLRLIDKENEYSIFLRKNNYNLFNPTNNRFKKIMADAQWYSLKEQLILPAVLKAEKLDIVHFPHFNIPLLYQGKFIVTIHDLTVSNFSTGQSSKRKAPVFFTKKLAYKFALKQALMRSEKILVPSEFVKKQIIDTFGVKNGKIAVTKEAADDFNNENVTPTEGKLKQIYGKYAIKNPYIIYLGNTYPYKNVNLILEALTKLPPEVNFVCVSKRDSFLENLENKAKELGVRNRVIFTGFVPDNDLKILLNQAIAFVFPSFSEGFGLPGLEAMGSLCPVIAANASSLPEIYGEAAIYFDPKSSDDLTKKIQEVYKKPSLGKELINRGRIQVKKYSWEKTAHETLNIYQSLKSKI